ncbi:MAG: SWIM zinc finger family protein [Clostridium sp.]
MSSYYGFAPYVSVAEKRQKADRQIEKLKKKNKDLEPVLIEGNKIALTWWGQSWNRNLESYADYSNRISRGKSYVKNHAVLNLKMDHNHVTALVQGSGSKPYTVTVTVDELEEKRWKKIIELCNKQIDSVEKLAEGTFPKELAVLFMEHKYGLFPSPAEIHFSCSCPDYAYMCKHVAAVLYGIGARLDKNPLLFFELRNVDYQELIKKSVENKLESMLKNAGKKSKRAIPADQAHDIFGI